MILIIFDASIKNKVAMLVSYIHRGQDDIVKNIHNAMNVMFTEAELFAIRYGINCATQMQDIKLIIVITDTIHANKHIFNTTVCLYQLHSIAIFKHLRGFFNKNSNKSIFF